MSTITTSSFEPLMPESLENRWIDYYSGLETSPSCDAAAVNLPFRVGTALYPDELCPPGIEGPPGVEPGTVPPGDPDAPAQTAP